MIQLNLKSIHTLTPCSLILSVNHLSSLRYSRREASAARSITKANGVPFSSIDRDWRKTKTHRLINHQEDDNYIEDKEHTTIEYIALYPPISAFSIKFYLTVNHEKHVHVSVNKVLGQELENLSMTHQII